MLRLRDWLIEPSVRRLDVDSPDFTIAHRRVLQNKAMLRSLFESFYRECRSMDLRYFASSPGKALEIGSGAGFMKQVFPDVLTSDSKHLPFVDLILRAEHIPVPQRSLRSIYAINVFHHLPDPRIFFEEALRVLHPGGGIVLIEPYYGLVARRLFKCLHESEGFDPDVLNWESTSCSGPASGANQALSYIVFSRDVIRFQQEFPEFELIIDRPHTHLLYILSGGVNFRQLAPNCLSAWIQQGEQFLSPLNRWIALQHTIVLRKCGQ